MENTVFRQETYKYGPMREIQKEQQFETNRSHSKKKSYNHRIFTQENIRASHFQKEYENRENMYISKLKDYQNKFKEQQHQISQIQELYKELFESYKQKQTQIKEMQAEFKVLKQNTCKHHESFTSFRQNQELQLTLRQRSQLEHLIQILREEVKAEKQINQELMSKLENLNSQVIRSRFLHSNASMYSQALSKNIIDQTEQWFSKAAQQREERIRLQYQNQFHKQRNQDLEKIREELQESLAAKQNQIIRMRQQKISVKRKLSQSRISPLSPARSTESIRSQNDLKQLNLTVSRLKQENKALKQCMVDGREDRVKGPGDEISSYQTNLQNEINEQYFSFSKEKNVADMELPEFPSDLEIETLIQKNKSKDKDFPIAESNAKGAESLKI